ncbi:MAG: replication-relaxation family protein [Planctomycetes bacterium]|nr:replication-relaxation family protein [Planctomycetota bacterium]
MATTTFCLVTPRDLDLFEALDRCPLTVRQLLKLSATFAYPFTTERRVQERLQCLGAAGRVRRWRYATAGQGALSYYTLTPLSYRLLHGTEAIVTGRGRFQSVGVARQSHTQALADVIVHLVVFAHAAGIPMEEFHRENTIRLTVSDESLYPDGAFTLLPSPQTRFSYFIELDNRTEPVRSGGIPDSWQRKVQFYERYQDKQSERFRVLVITAGGPERLGNMLRCAADVATNPRRSLVYGVTLRDFLAAEDVITAPCFRTPFDLPISLIGPRQSHRETTFCHPSQAGAPVIASAACLRPLAKV